MPLHFLSVLRERERRSHFWLEKPMFKMVVFKCKKKRETRNLYGDEINMHIFSPFCSQNGKRVSEEQGVLCQRFFTVLELGISRSATGMMPPLCSSGFNLKRNWH